MASLWTDTRYPLGMLRLESEHCSQSGSIQAALMNVGGVLGTGAWSGLPERHETKTQLAIDPSSAADIIVSILYQYSPKLLEDFFLASRFTYIHRYDGDDPSQAPEGFECFAMTRQGPEIMAGFCKDSGAVDAIGDLQWTRYLVYELKILRQCEFLWYQVHLSLHATPSQAARDRSDYDDVPTNPLECQQWEQEAVLILAPALIQRRWVERPGVFRVDIVPVEETLPNASTTSPKERSSSNPGSTGVLRLGASGLLNPHLQGLAAVAAGVAGKLSQPAVSLDSSDAQGEQKNKGLVPQEKESVV